MNEISTGVFSQEDEVHLIDISIGIDRHRTKTRILSEIYESKKKK